MERQQIDDPEVMKDLDTFQVDSVHIFKLLEPIPPIIEEKKVQIEPLKAAVA